MRLRRTERVDLHVHSRFSDGVDEPASLVAAPVAAVSICDHDTIRAYDDLPEAGSEGALLLPGVELTARLGRTDREVHILGYFPDGFTPAFRDFVGEREEDRRARVRQGVSALRNDGIPVKWADFEAEVGDAVPCRTHVARCLVRIGWPRRPDQLYDGFMNRNRFRATEITTKEVIGTIGECGGIAIWAHPPEEALATYGEALLEEGLRGLEVNSPAMRGSRRAAAIAFAEEHGLLRSGGTDSHGGRKKRVGWYRVTVDDVSAELFGSARVLPLNT